MISTDKARACAIRIDNLNILTERFPRVWEALKNHRPPEPAEERFVALEAKNGAPTLTVEKDDKTLYIHSKYDPEQEAEKLVAQFQDVAKYRHVFFYGAGLGYHIEAFVKKYPDIPVTIYEPYPAAFALYLAHKSLATLPRKALAGIYVETSPADSARFLSEFADFLHEEVLFISLPSYERLFPENHKKFTTLFRDVLADKRVALRTNYAYEKRWTLNSICNFRQVISTPNILAGEVKRYFHNRPAVIVAAGPSLNEEIENIRLIKEKGLAYIFSVGSGTVPLLNNGIHPDATCTYDPKRNVFVFKSIIENNIDSIPLIFGSSVGTDIFPAYPGPLFHMIMSQDTVSPYFLRFPTGEKLEIIQDAPTIAVVTLQLLVKLGCNRVIFAGQNLAYKDRFMYAGDISYYHHLTEVSEEKMKNAFQVEDVYGGKAYTNDSLNRMRLSLEFILKQYPDREFINTTKGGARITGTSFLPMENVIREKLRGKVVEKDWHKNHTTCYDRDYMVKQQKLMNEGFIVLERILRSFTRNFEIMENLASRSDAGQLEKLFPKIDKELKKLLRNRFYQVFLKPIKRVELELLAKKIDKIRFEPDSVTKARQVREEFGKFIEGCRKELEVLKPLYDELQAVIDPEGKKPAERTG